MDRDARGAVARHHGMLREESGRAAGVRTHVMLSKRTGALTPYTPSDLTTRRISKKSLDTEQSCGEGSRASGTNAGALKSSVAPDHQQDCEAQQHMRQLPDEARTEHTAAQEHLIEAA